ncbi:MAG: shikimate dehydrogenase [Marivibrio sp.]|uniref:shikimate dehydrogenase n=1 Tax=Marivibrio sp. TaxID=2039719 RepID=UPI0032F033B9
MSALRRAGVLGWPIEHSLSPVIHGLWLKRFGIAGRYERVAVEPERFAAETLRLLQEQGWRGMNVTAPHKEAAVRVVDRLDAAAERIGAVNTVVACADGRVEGRNTDLYGFRRNLETAAGWERVGRRAAVVIGAGGASRAVVCALLDLGFKEVRILNRTVEKARALRDDLSVKEGMRLAPLSMDWAAPAMEGADLLVNTTSLGMTGRGPLDLPLDPLPREAFVTDIVYAPLETDLLTRARARGHAVVDGLGMLLHQAVPGFEAWFEPPEPPAVDAELRAAVLAAMPG